MPIIHDDFVFIHIPKTGGTSIRQMFIRDYPGSLTIYGEKHLPLREYFDSLVQDRFKFTIVRNPYERQVSFYQHFLRNLAATPEEISFKDFFYMRSLEPNFYQEYFIQDINCFDKVYQTESFSEMIDDLCKMFGYKFTKIRTDGKKFKYNRDYMSYYDSDMMNILNGHEPTLLKHFNYASYT